MTKVLTVTTHVGVVDPQMKYHAQEYPELNTYLNDNYKIRDVIRHAPTNESKHAGYSLTFILEKSG